MKTATEIMEEIRVILNTEWERREGQVVPEPESVTLGNDAVTIDGTVLYADMADSTDLVDGFKDWFAAEIYKCYLVAASHLIRNNFGEITAFDGDRVMAVYIGSSKNSNAVKTALQLNWTVEKINSMLKSKYPNSAFQLKHTVGVDTSGLFVTKTGIRKSNDLVWVGRAANYAAKLCGVSQNACITESVFQKLSDQTKYGGEPKQIMWTKLYWAERNVSYYQSDWTWQP